MFTSSPAGTEFTKQHEGFVSKAYKDQGGVVTIGFGFTNLSPTCRNWFIEHWGHPLRMGDKMVLADAVQLLNAVLTNETGPVANGLAPATQSAFDAENDVIYNCGPKAATWQWALAAKAQDYATAAKRLLTTAVTAMGVPSSGLRKRRADEATLLQSGAYPAHDPTTTSGDAMKQVQRDLSSLGFYKGNIDGNRGPLTIGAVRNFQRAYGLKVDGVVGPATRSAIARAVGAKFRDKASIGSGVGTGGAGWITQNLGLHLDNPWVIVAVAAGAVVVIYLAFLVWHNRGAILRKRTPA